MRLIDADALIAELQKDEAKWDKEAEDTKDNPSYTECYSIAMCSRANGVRDAIVEVYDAPTIDAVSVVHGEWVPCSERLPEENVAVLTQAKFKDDIKMAVSARQDYNYWTGWGKREVNIVAWMPLPEPYGEREGD